MRSFVLRGGEQVGGQNQRVRGCENYRFKGLVVAVERAARGISCPDLDSLDEATGGPRQLYFVVRVVVEAEASWDLFVSSVDVWCIGEILA